LAFKRPDPQNCVLRQRGPGDIVTAPILAGDMLSCFIATIALKVPGVAHPPRRSRSAAEPAQRRTRAARKRPSIRLCPKNREGEPFYGGNLSVAHHSKVCSAGCSVLVSYTPRTHRQGIVMSALLLSAINGCEQP
jgi:hypothetical protein